VSTDDTITDQYTHPAKPMFLRRAVGWVGVAVIAGSLVTCAVLTMIRSTGLVRVTVTALDPLAEPRDHTLPLIKKREAMPDYQLVVKLNRGERIKLGVRPDASAADGLTWALSDPVAVADIASIRLEDEDQLLSDAVAEVQMTGDVVEAGSYRFAFETEQSVSVGIHSFFQTPMGRTIILAFVSAVIAFVGSVLHLY
jgi:hypothetical protein